jgi:coenzyme F420 biosynthesis associated uncharacterized protein
VTAGPARRRRLAAEYNRLAAEVEGPFLRAVGGLPSGVTLPAFDALDRHGWVDLNIGILRDAMEPMLELQARLPNSRLIETGRALMDRYVGLILGFLSRRVLGQYDPQLLVSEPRAVPGLYLVEPNIQEWEEEADLPGEALRRWLILHEMTHAWQFAAHPWLRDHMNGMLRHLLGSALDSGASSLDRLLSITIGAWRQWGVIGRVQSTMSLVEGYSNLVMDLVGSKELPEFERLEEAYQRRSGQKSVFEFAFWKLTGLEMKLQQYVVGERFCRHVYDARGMEYLNRAWESPDTLPSAAELRNPDAWMTRIDELAAA